MSAADDDNVADLDRRRTDQEREAQARLEKGVRAAADALFESLGHQAGATTDVRVTMAVTYGDPTREYSITSADFFSLDDRGPVTDAHRRALALAAVKAASPELFARLSYGLQVADMLERLQQAADVGNVLAAEKLRWLESMSEPDAG